MRELDRLKVIEAIIEGRLKPAAAAQRLRLTTRQVHRLVLRYREDGPTGLTSRRRDQPSNRQLSPGLENRAISLIRRNYSATQPARLLRRTDPDRWQRSSLVRGSWTGLHAAGLH
ncbi:helix-turn-helix domain-containing protein [Pseudomonas aeruginosa]